MRDRLLWTGLIIIVASALALLQHTGVNPLLARLLGLTAIWSIAAVALNLTNGTTGFVNLGQHGFMLVGAYVTAILTANKSTAFLMAPWAQKISISGLTGYVPLQMAIAVLAGGIVAALFGLLIGIPSLRLRGDYLSMVTLGFGEAIRYVAATDQGALLTNGGLGIRGIPGVYGHPLWAFAWLVVTLLFFTRFTQSSYGRALKSIREDEMAASAVGVRVTYHKVLAFTLSAGFAGIAGGLYASWLQTIDPATFQIFLMIYLLAAVAVGGIGSNTGALFGTALVVMVRHYMQPIELEQQPGPLIGWLLLVLIFVYGGWTLGQVRNRIKTSPAPTHRTRSLFGIGIGLVLGVALISHWLPWEWLATPRSFSGMRNVILALCLLTVMIYRPLGLFGRGEFGWGLLFDRKSSEITEVERQQDAWLDRNPPA